MTNPPAPVSDGEAGGDAVVGDGDGVTAGDEDAAAGDAWHVGAAVGVADVPYAVVAEVAAVRLAIHKPTAKTAPVSRVMMADLSFMLRCTPKGSRLVQPAKPVVQTL